MDGFVSLTWVGGMAAEPVVDHDPVVAAVNDLLA
jgi:hypothetical protein